MNMDAERRFGGVSRLFGAVALQRFQAARICIVGIGGVGSWVAEALARSAVGRITLIDLDMIAESNVNRQIHAQSGEFGKAKVTAMVERMQAINPDGQFEAIEDFVTPENVGDMLGGGFDHVVDAIDQVRTKAAMIAWCHCHRLPIVTTGGAGGQTDPTKITIADLSRTIQDPLLAKVRSLLRKEYGFARDTKKKFGIPAVYSSEPLRYPVNQDSSGSCEVSRPSSGLNCAGYGSSVCVTASFGFSVASSVLHHLAEDLPSSLESG